MIVPDIFASIIPGHSAAGFLLGQRFDQFEEVVNVATRWNKSLLQLSQVVANTEEWLLIENTQLGSFDRPHDHKPLNAWLGCRLYFGKGAVMLHFNSNNLLNYIEIGTGYQGTLYETIRIGDELKSILQFYDLEYDDVEELHFPINGNDVGLISFYAEEQSLDDYPEQIINCMFVESLYQPD
jgi:hypothetical protein